MRKKLFIIGFVVAICLVCYGIWERYPKYNSIDLRGTNNDWKATFNINANYKNSELIITPSTDKLKLPDRIIVDIYVKNKGVYSSYLNIKKQDNFSNFGEYRCKFDHDEYIIKNHKNITIVISYDNTTSEIPLTIVEYIN